MVVYEAGGLHQGVADGAAHELEAAAFHQGGGGSRLATSTGPALARTGGIAVAKGGGRQTESVAPWPDCESFHFLPDGARPPLTRHPAN